MGTGGSRYGAGRPAHNLKAESVQRVDVRRWARSGYFERDSYFSWGWNCGGEPSGNINVQSTPDSATLIYRIKDRYNDEWQDKRQVVPVVRTPCAYGGSRKWFRCPVCARRCELLYLRAYRFACRKCQRIAYTSQSGGTMDRLMNKSHKLQAKVADGRPKGMRWRTYDRIWEQVNDIEARVDHHFLARCAALAQSKG
jgi:hypothetical protein